MRTVKVFVSGIGTGVGKSIVSAAIVNALAADYWKPIQTGCDDGTDSEFIERITKQRGEIFSEQYCLRDPLSPHAAAENEGVTIDLNTIVLPDTENHLVVEGAGGLLVPLTSDVLLIDLIKALSLPVVLVVRPYLGCINHSLLSLEALRTREISLHGIVFSGEPVPQSEEIIKRFSQSERFARIPEYATVDQEAINKASEILQGLFLL